MKASGPSFASSLMNTFIPMLESMRMASCSDTHSVSRNAAQHGLHRDRPVGRDRVSDLTRAVERHPVGYDLADETDLLRFGCTDVAPGEEQVRRDRVRDLPAQPHDRTPEGIKPPTHLGHTEPSALTGDTYVCRLKDLGAARDRGTLHRRDERLVEEEALQQRLDHAAGQVRRRLVVTLGEHVARVSLGHRLEVRAGAEATARAGEDRYPDVADRR